VPGLLDAARTTGARQPGIECLDRRGQSDRQTDRRILSTCLSFASRNLRHYEFMREGRVELAAEMRKRRVEFVMRRLPDHGFGKFCSEVRPCLVIGDENSMRESLSGLKSAAKTLWR